MKILRAIAIVALLALGMAAQANAGVIIVTAPGFVQPEENLLLQGTGLTTTGNPVQGQTNQTAAIFNIMGNEILTLPSNGQARVEATEGNFASALIYPDNPLVFFTLFEANVNVEGTPSITVTAKHGENLFESLTYTGGPGQNYFGVQATGGSVLYSILIETPGQSIQDIRQIRIGGITGYTPPPTPVPEPTSLILLGTGLGTLGLASRRKKK